MNRHGCINPTLGAECAARSSLPSTSSGTSASGTNLRMSRRSVIARYTAWRSTALNACSVTPASLGGTIVSVSRDDVLITATELAQRLSADEPLTILDVRWQLTEPDGRAGYERGHLPGAVYVSLEDELSDHSVSGRGRHPLPSGRSVEAAARRWGVRNGVPVVVYDDWNRAGSARAWWVLTAAGLPEVRILDGGLSAWAGPLEIGSVTPEPGDVTVAHDDLYAGCAADADGRAGRRLPGVRCSTRGRPSVSAVTSNPSTRSPATSPEPGTCRAPGC